MKEAVRYSEVRAEGENTHIHCVHISVRNINYNDFMNGNGSTSETLRSYLQNLIQLSVITKTDIYTTNFQCIRRKSGFYSPLNNKKQVSAT